MLGNLYLIKNRVNDMKYVGKTYSSLDRRFAEHINDSRKFPNRSLYKAINELGASNFYIELVATYEQGILEIKEQELISELATFILGYNDTLGGEGRRRLKYTDEEIIAAYKGNVEETSRTLNIAVETIVKVLTAYNIERGTTKHKVYCEKLDETFESVTACADYLIKTGIAKSTDVEIVRRSLSRHLNGNRKSYLKMVFEKV